MNLTDAVRQVLRRYPELGHNTKVAYVHVCHALGLISADQIVHCGPNYESVARLIRRFR